jgi:hypothetical protein
MKELDFFAKLLEDGKISRREFMDRAGYRRFRWRGDRPPRV